MTMKGT